MRLSYLVTLATLSLVAQASWFSNSPPDPEYAGWNTKELRGWLELHNVPIPENTKSHSELTALVGENWHTASTWTHDQYLGAQQIFSALHDTAFETWDESRLRKFLLDHGVVAPKGPKEELVIMAQHKYRQYNNAASSIASGASAAASSAVFEKPGEMTRSVSSFAAQATDDVSRKFDYTKDYVYSTWTDNQLRKWLEEKGVLKTKTQLQRDELLRKVHDAYNSATTPVWNSWSDSNLHSWLLNHNIIKSDYEKNRDSMVKLMKDYYYGATDAVYSTWSDSDLKNWLVERGYMKSNAQASRDKMLKIVQDNYLNAKDTFWNAWSDNSIRQWLIEHGYMRSDAQYKRDELIKLANEKYVNFWNKWTDQQARTAAYLSWPDARLRAYLREHGVNDSQITGTRPSLLQETRIRWVQTQNRAESLFARIKELVNSSTNKVEDILLGLRNLLGSGWEDTKEKTGNGQQHVRYRVYDDYEAAKEAGEKYYDAVKGRAYDTYEEMTRAGRDIKGRLYDSYEGAKAAGEQYYDAASGRAYDSYDDMKRAADGVGSDGEGVYGDVKDKAYDQYESAKGKAYETYDSAKGKAYDQYDYAKQAGEGYVKGARDKAEDAAAYEKERIRQKQDQQREKVKTEL